MSYTMERWQERVHGNAREKGFWDGEALDPRKIEHMGKRIALIHSEVSEAFEEVRAGKPDLYWVRDKHNRDKPEGLSIELADVVIRVLDWCGGLGIDLEEAMAHKHNYNRTRPHMHGKKC